MYIFVHTFIYLFVSGAVTLERKTSDNQIGLSGTYTVDEVVGSSSVNTDTFTQTHAILKVKQFLHEIYCRVKEKRVSLRNTNLK